MVETGNGGFGRRFLFRSIGRAVDMVRRDAWQHGVRRLQRAAVRHAANPSLSARIRLLPHDGLPERLQPPGTALRTHRDGPNSRSGPVNGSEEGICGESFETIAALQVHSGANRPKARSDQFSRAIAAAVAGREVAGQTLLRAAARAAQRAAPWEGFARLRFRDETEPLQ